jgi:hypothetical protein
MGHYPRAPAAPQLCRTKEDVDVPAVGVLLPSGPAGQENLPVSTETTRGRHRASQPAKITKVFDKPKGLPRKYHT